MRSVRLEDLAGLLGARFGPGTGGVPAGGPRVVASGNFATPLTVLGALDGAVPEYRLNVLNAQPGLPTRPGVVHETSFVGPGMRRTPGLAYVPSRLSLVPTLSRPPCRRTSSSCTRPGRAPARCPSASR